MRASPKHSSTLPTQRLWPALPRPLAFAHRGGAGLWPENTVFAFRNAQRLGCHVMELDVHLTRDGELVVCHDPTVDRTTNGLGAIREMTFRDLSALDAAHHHQLGETGVYPLRDKGLRIPSLLHVIKALPDGYFNIDLKGEGPVAEAVFAFVEQHDLSERVLVASESHRKLTRFRALAGANVPTSASRREVLAFWLRLRSGQLRARAGWSRRLPYRALQVPLRAGPLRVVDERFVHAARDLGLEVHVWTLDTRAKIEQVLEWGVAGVMSDYPDLLVTCLG